MAARGTRSTARGGKKQGVTFEEVRELALLTDTLHAHRRRLPTPSLLPLPEALQLANAA